MSQGQEYELASPPSDGVSSMSFSPMPSNLLLVTSWDQTVRLYDVVNNTQKAKFEVRASHSAPLQLSRGPARRWLWRIRCI